MKIKQNIINSSYSNATGEEMAQIAYENRIPFARFIHNADEIIDEFNEHKFRKHFLLINIIN